VLERLPAGLDLDILALSRFRLLDQRCGSAIRCRR